MIIPSLFGMVNCIILKRRKETLPYEASPSRLFLYAVKTRRLPADGGRCRRKVTEGVTGADYSASRISTRSALMTIERSAISSGHAASPKLMHT